MFAKFGADKLKRRANLKNNLLAKLKQQAEASMPKIGQILDTLFPKKKPVIVYHLDDHAALYAVDDKPVLVELGGGQVFPLLKYAMEYPGLLPCVYVDDGAIKALKKGADLMAPGIKQCPQSFDSGEVIEIRLLETTIPFAIGVTTVSYDEMLENNKGVAIQVKHVLGDGLWNIRDGI